MTAAIVRAQNRVDGRLAGIYPAIDPAVYPALWTVSSTPRTINDIAARLAAADLLGTTRPIQRAIATPTGATDKGAVYEDWATQRLEDVATGKEELYDPVTKKRLPRLAEWEQITVVAMAAPSASMTVLTTSSVDLSGWTVVVRIAQTGTARKGEVKLTGRSQRPQDAESVWMGEQKNEDRVADRRWRSITTVDSSALLGGDAGAGVTVGVFAKRNRWRGSGGRSG